MKVDDQDNAIAAEEGLPHNVHGFSIDHNAPECKSVHAALFCHKVVKAECDTVGNKVLYCPYGEYSAYPIYISLELDGFLRPKMNTWSTWLRICSFIYSNSSFTIFGMKRKT